MGNLDINSRFEYQTDISKKILIDAKHGQNRRREELEREYRRAVEQEKRR